MFYRFHGCSECYNPNEIEVFSRKTMAQLKKETNNKIRFFNQLGYVVIQKFSHDFNRETKDKNSNLSRFLAAKYKHICSGDIKPRDGLYGGRYVLGSDPPQANNQISSL